MAGGVRTTCPYCGVGCGVIATAQPDGSLSVRGDPDHPANYGRLCSKGAALGETVDLDGRLLHPEINGQRAFWDDALDLIAEEFSETVRQYGPDSVAFYVSGQLLSEDYYVANKLMKGFIGSANIDTNSRLCMASSVAGHRRAFGTDTVPGVYEDLEEADLIVLVGSNLLWCHPVLYQRIAAAKAARPAMRVVLIDPRSTKTADLADMHLAIAPDSDTALFVGLLNWLHRHDAIKAQWAEQHTAGLDGALAAAKHWPVDAVARATGLGQEEIRQFYALWAGRERVVTAFSQGVNQSAVGTDKVNAIINCHLATARIGRPGMGPFSLTGQPNAMGGRETGGLATMLAAHLDIDNPAHRDLLSRFWNAPSVARSQGLKAVDLFRAVADGRIRALWIMASNPAVSMPDAAAVEAAIANCPFVVVSDMMAETDTVRHARVKLPSLGWGEKDGTVTNSERRISRQRAFLPAPGEARADWWQMAEVARRMGFESAFGWADTAAVFAEYAALTAYENDGARDLDLSALADISKAEFDALAPFQWPQTGSFDATRQNRFFADGGFFTPDRKACCVAVTPSATPTAIPATGGFRLNTGRVRDHWHTMTRTAKSPRLNLHIAEPYCELHPADAQRLGIQAADLVRLTGDGQTILARALLTTDQPAGTVFVPMHWNDQFAGSSRVNRLVDGVTDPVSGQPALKGSRVSVARAPMRCHGFAVTAQKPRTNGLAYWALAPILHGWRLEFALEDPLESIETFVAMLACEPSWPLVAADRHRGLWRAAQFDGEQLVSAVFLGHSPVEVSRSFAIEQLATPFPTPARRWQALAGRPAADRPDKGAIICACMSVGVNEIAASVHAGCRTVDAVGHATAAGTNCGSCRAEITEIINADHLVAAE
jgi:assimilatory nitrate reductase catalytic subunit